MNLKNTKFPAIALIIIFFVLLIPQTTYAALNGPGSSLVGWWKLDDGQGATSAFDSSGNSRTGTINGTPNSTSTSYYLLGSAYEFDASNDWIDVADFVEAENTTTLTVGGWFKSSVAASTSAMTIMSKMRGISGFSGWSLTRTSAEKFQFYANNGSVTGTALSDSTYADTDWHHVMAVYNGTDIRIYVDGVSAMATPPSYTSTLANVTDHVCIGSTNNSTHVCTFAGNSQMSGVLDDLRIYNRALSSTEVRQLYDNGLELIVTETTATVATVAASSITSTAATLNGTTTSTGGTPVTTRGFQYGTTISYGATTTESGTFTYRNNFSSAISGLTCNTSYHFRAYNTNATGTSYGSDTTFTTSTCSSVRPTVTTDSTSSVTSTTTVMTGTITDTGNQTVTARGFNYGLTTAYGATTTYSGSFSAGSFSTTTSGLTCNSTYHYRAFATNSTGPGYGSDGTFTTATCSPTITSFDVASTSTSLTVNVNSFAAIDNVSVFQYFLSEINVTPTTTDYRWTTSRPTTFTFRGPGHKTLYAWAKDNEGNISASSSDTVVINLNTYTPPIGIPNPANDFGVFGQINQATPSWPAEWLAVTTSAKTDYYFIDNSDPLCTNTSNTYGHPQLPRCAPPEGLLNAGAYIYFNGGTYTPALSAGDRYDWNGMGTAANPIWITGNPYTRPLFTEKIQIGAVGPASYIVLENLDMEGVTNSGSILIYPGVDNDDVDHIIVRNIKIVGNGSDLDNGGIAVGLSVSVSVTPNSLTSYIVLYDNEISRIGYIGPDGAAGDEPGILNAHNTDHVWVLDSTIHHVGSDSVAGSHYSNNADKYTHNYFIGRNILYQNGENSIDLKTVEKSVISENIMFGPHQDENGWAVVLHYGAYSNNPTRDAWVLYNKIYDSGGGIGITDGENAYIIGNEIVGVHQKPNFTDSVDGTCMGVRGTDGIVKYINNTCYDYDEGIYFGPTLSASTGDFAYINGNIFSNRKSTGRFDINISGGATESTLVDMDYNLFNPISGTPSFNWSSATRTLAYMQGTALECTHCVSSDPLFASTTGRDFRLTSSSPAKDVGIQDSVYDLFFSNYGVSIEKDFLNLARPQNSVWDLGAYEYPVTDSTAPNISAVASSTSVTTATITWTTSEDATSTISYGPTVSYGTASSSAISTTSQSIMLSGLSSDTLYHFRIVSQDAAYNSTTSQDYTFRTTSVTDFTAPTVSMTAPSNGVTVSGGSVSITASASDDTAVSGVQFKRGTNTFIGSEDGSSPYSTSWDTTELSDGSYTLFAVARDSSNNYATSSSITVTVDNTAPVLSAGSPSGSLDELTTSTTISATTNEIATCKYSTSSGSNYSSDMTEFSTTGGTSHSTTVSGLTSGSSYTYYVKCSDALGNINSTDYSITFNISSDTSGPTLQSVTSTVTSTSATISWSSDELSTSKIYYGTQSGVYTSNTTLVESLSTSHSVTLSGLTTATKYYYIIVSNDSLDNVATSSEYTFTPVDSNTRSTSSGSGFAGGGGGGAPAISAAKSESPKEVTKQVVVNIQPIAQPLTKGISSPQVKELQKYLNVKGYVVAKSGPGSPGKETDTFGNATQNALKDYQIKNGILPVTGVLDKKTLDFINNDIKAVKIVKTVVVPANSNTPSPSTFTRELSVGKAGEDVKALQVFLNNNGFIINKSGPGAPGKETSTFGSATKAKLMEFQKENGIPATGYVGPKTLEKIKEILKK